VRGQDGLARAAPRPTDDRTRENPARLPLEQQVTGLELLVLDVLPQDARLPVAPVSARPFGSFFVVGPGPNIRRRHLSVCDVLPEAESISS
jgi:hypothetical protein